VIKPRRIREERGAWNTGEREERCVKEFGGEA